MTPGELRWQLKRRYPDVTVTAESDGLSALITAGDGSTIGISVGPGRSLILETLLSDDE